MPDALDDRPPVSREEPSADAVRAYIERNPDFLATLFTPHPAEQLGAVDLQRHIVDGLRRSLEQRDARARRILAAAEARAQAVERVHGACRAAIGAFSLDDVICRVGQDFPDMLDIDSAALVIQDRVAPARFKALGRRVGRIRLGPVRAAERTVLGARARSAATIGLKPPDGMPRAFLLLGSADPDGFAAEHGAELLEFLGEILAFCIRRWLRPPA